MFILFFFFFFVCVCLFFWWGQNGSQSCKYFFLYIGITDAATQIVYIGICGPSGAAKKKGQDLWHTAFLGDRI